MGVLYKKCECVRTLGNKESEKNEEGICCKKTEFVIEIQLSYFLNKIRLP